MKKIKNLPESQFQKLFFAFITLCFLTTAVCLPDRNEMFTGLWRIFTSTCKISTNYFAVGGFSATFLNMGLVGLVCLLLYLLPGAKATSSSTLAFLLTVGFGSWGINPLNMLPTVLGVLLYCLVKKENPANQVNSMLYSTGIAPLISELLLRYPNETASFHWYGPLLALFIGLVIGFTLPAGLAHSPKVHKGFDLYSAALPIGMMAFFLQAALYKSTGVPLPEAPNNFEAASQFYVNLFCAIVFGLCVVFALLLGCKPKDYWKLVTGFEQIPDFSATYGNAVFLMNAGIFGFFILTYYNLIGAGFNGITFGIIFCMLATCNSGSHPGNVLAIILGYALASLSFWGISHLTGSHFTGFLNSQAIVVGLCYATGLSPISDKYGFFFGSLAGFMHYTLVTSVPMLHGGYCLYNGGFTAALICLILVPTLERFLHTKAERRAVRLEKRKQRLHF